MPLYEYLCEDCERSFERLSSFAAANDASCPTCGGSHTRRLLSVIGGLSGQSAAPGGHIGGKTSGVCVRRRVLVQLGAYSCN